MTDTSSTSQEKAYVQPTEAVKVLEIGNANTADQNQRPFNRLYPYLLAGNAALGTLYFGYILADFNIINNFVSSYAFDEEVHKVVLNFMTSFVPLGAAIGAVMAGKISAMIGRRMSMFLFDFLSLIGTILTLLPSQYSLLIGRLLQGYTVGANSSIVPLYIRETAPAEIAARIGTGTQLSICTGTLLAPIMGLGMPIGLNIDPENQYFRIVLAVAGLPPLLRMLLNLMVFRFETPRYLVTKDKEPEALAVLNKIYSPTRAQEELTALKTEKEIMMKSDSKVTIKEIFSNKYRRRLFVGVMMSIFQQFSGINAIIFYSNNIFSQGITDVESQTPTVYTIVMNLVQIVAVIASGMIVERVGRKLLSFIGMALVSTVIIAFGIVCLFVSDSPVLKFFIWGYMIGFGLSVGSLLWVILADILPDIGMGIATFVNWMCAFIVGYTFPVMVEDIGIAWTFIIFGGFGFLGTLFIVFFLKETKGKTEAEIMALYGGKAQNAQ